MTDSSAGFRVAARFNGPPGSGNGGWTAGAAVAVARELGAVLPLTVSLKAPPPLERELLVAPDPAAGGWVVTDDAGAAVLTVRPGAVLSGEDADPGPAVDLDTARAVEASYAGLGSHPFPTCFVCGPDRAPGDGLRIFPGRLPDGRVAASWTPDPSLTQGDGPGGPGGTGAALTWAALDCAGGWSSDIDERPMVLAAMSAAPEPGHPAPRAGTAYVVVGRLVRTEARKTWTTTGLYAADGALLARAQQLWIEIRR